MREITVQEIAFDNFRFRIWPRNTPRGERFRLYRDPACEELIRLQTRDLEVLNILLSGDEHGIVRTEDTILNGVWGDEKGNLASLQHSISVLRKNFNDMEPYRFIGNAKKGYKFRFVWEICG